jgi:hypothetical protein
MRRIKGVLTTVYQNRHHRARCPGCGAAHARRGAVIKVFKSMRVVRRWSGACPRSRSGSRVAFGPGSAMHHARAQHHATRAIPRTRVLHCARDTWHGESSGCPGYGAAHARRGDAIRCLSQRLWCAANPGPAPEPVWAGFAFGPGSAMHHARNIAQRERFPDRACCIAPRDTWHGGSSRCPWAASARLLRPARSGRLRG